MTTWKKRKLILYISQLILYFSLHNTSSMKIFSSVLTLFVLSLFGCTSETHEITYEVDSLKGCTINYTNEFGTNVWEDVIVEGNECHWSKKIIYNADVFGKTKKITLFAGFIGLSPSYGHVKIYIDNELVKEDRFVSKEIDKKLPSLSIEHNISD